MNLDFPTSNTETDHLFEPYSSIYLNKQDKLPSIIHHDDVPRHLPDFVKCYPFQTKDGPALFYLAEAKKEKRRAFGFSGFKADFVLEPKEIKHLNEQGTSLGWIALPNVRRKTGIVDAYIDLATQAVTDPQLDKIGEFLKEGTPIILTAHSTGGQVIFHMIRDDDTLPTLGNTFNGAALSSPYLRSPLEQGLRGFLKVLPENYLNNTAIETVPGQFYMLNHDSGTMGAIGHMAKKLASKPAPEIEDVKQAYFGYKNPTYGQVLELLDRAKPILADLENPSSNIYNIPFEVMIYSGEGDRYSAVGTQKDFAQKLGFAFHTTPGGKHTPCDVEKTLKLLSLTFTRMANGNFKSFGEKAGLYLPPPKPQAASAFPWSARQAA